MTANPTQGVCLFSAPFAFLGDLRPEYDAVMPTVFREIWTKQDVRRDLTVRAWVVNPGQGFVIDSGVLDEYPSLEVLVTPSTGTNHIDREACARHKVVLFGLLDDREGLEQISASAEFTFLLLLTVLRRLDLGMAEVGLGRWRDHEDLLRGYELGGKQVGLVGFGRIGRRLAGYCEAFGAHAAYHDPYVTNASIPAWSLEQVFEQSAVVCVCCALTAETEGMIGRNLLARLPPEGVLINTSRGEVIVEADLAAVLSERADLRVGLDVLSGEVSGTWRESPLLPLRESGRLVITPHMAGVAIESQQKAARSALGLLRRHLERHRSARVG